jgi:hypothetical protein
MPYHDFHLYLRKPILIDTGSKSSLYPSSRSPAAWHLQASFLESLFAD